MKTTAVVSVCAATAFAFALFDATAAEAAKRSVAARSTVVKRNVQPRVRLKPTARVKIQTKTVKTSKVIKTPKLVSKKVTTNVTKTPKLVSKKVITNVVQKNAKPKFVQSNTLKFGKVKLKNLPIHKAAAGNKLLKGRIGLTPNVKPKLTLTAAPKMQFQHRLSPFVQKHWKKAFFWVAVAGLGYVSVPEYYYDRFLTYVNLDDPDYEECIRLLSYAALEEEEEIIRVPMPPTATYRFSAKTPPVRKELAVSPQEGATACTLTPFVERKWNQSFVWVQVPETGNVTVPEDYYDRFYGNVSGDPPNYLGACQVLVEAAAADMMTAITSVDTRGPQLQ